MLSTDALAVQVHLPLPHDKQKSVLLSPAKRKIVVTGRRAGKTVMAAIMAVQYLLRGKRVLYAAPTQDQTDAFWDAVCRFLADMIFAAIIKKNETLRKLEIEGTEGRIRAETCWNPDVLRGDFADLLILDEYSIADPKVWTEVGLPMLLDTNGDALIIFTPKKKNHAWKLYLQARAKAQQGSRWAVWHFTTYDNPYLSQEALAEIVEEMTEEEFQQEILAEFLEDAGQVFRNIDACMKAPITKPDEHKDHILVAGVDWGKKHDFTAISVGCATCRREVFLDRYNLVDYTLQVARLEIAYTNWRVRSSVAETNAMGDPLLEQLQKLGVSVIGFQMTGTSKPGLIENLALHLEKGDFQYLDDPNGRIEMEAYEMATNLVTNRRTYSAPHGMHDDTVIARALMMLAIRESPTAPRVIKQKVSPLEQITELF